MVSKMQGKQFQITMALQAEITGLCPHGSQPPLKNFRLERDIRPVFKKSIV